MGYSNFGIYGGFRPNFEYLGEFVPRFDGVYVKKPELPSKKEIWSEARTELFRINSEAYFIYVPVTLEDIIIKVFKSKIKRIVQDFGLSETKAESILNKLLKRFSFQIAQFLDVPEYKLISFDYLWISDEPCCLSSLDEDFLGINSLTIHPKPISVNFFEPFDYKEQEAERMLADLFVNVNMPTFEGKISLDRTFGQSGSSYYKKSGTTTISNLEQKLINWIFIFVKRCIPKKKEYFDIKTPRQIEFQNPIFSFMHCKSSLSVV